VDDWGWNNVGYHRKESGAPLSEIQTPHIDVGAHGVMVSDCLSVTVSTPLSVCLPESAPARLELPPDLTVIMMVSVHSPLTQALVASGVELDRHYVYQVNCRALPSVRPLHDTAVPFRSARRRECLSSLGGCRSTLHSSWAIIATPRRASRTR
jgi:hypothetical protein